MQQRKPVHIDQLTLVMLVLARTHLHTQAKLWPALVWVNVICTFSARAALAKASPLSLYSSLQHTNDLEFT